MGKKKHKKAMRAKQAEYARAEHHGGDSHGYGYGYGYGEGDGGPQHGGQYGYAGAEGLLRGLPHLLKSRQSEQFLLGALVGAAAAYLLSDEELRGKLVKTGIKLYSGLAGSFEEMKEQMADLKAEVEAEQQGNA